MFLAVESGDTDIAERVNKLKRALVGQEGGVFYINEYQHLIVPVARNGTSHCFSGGKIEADFTFEFEGKHLTTKPVDMNGNPLKPGDAWVGPRPGVPYKLSAGGKDIYYESPVLTDAEPPEVRQRVTQKVHLSKVHKNKSAVTMALKPVLDVRGYEGGRFYVNEQSAIFTPVHKGDGNGLDYIYCAQVDLSAWFPEPPLY